MRGRTLCWLLGLAAALPAAALAVDVLFESPPPGEPVFGEVEVAAEVFAQAPIERVVLSVDGRVVGELARPPFRWRVDIGQSNREHRFEVFAEDTAGDSEWAVLVTPAIPIDLSVELALQQLYVTVTRGERRVLDLGPQDFAVFDDGERQRLVTFERGDVPLVALVLLDASDSMRGRRLAAAAAGAEAFIAGLEELDQAKLLLFSDHVVHSTPFTNFAEVLRAGLSGVEARGGTALNDHLYLALKLLDERQGRRVVILLSDGIDVASVLRMREVLRSARRSQALIYWLRLGGVRGDREMFSSWRDDKAHREELELLEQAVVESGGRAVQLDRIEEAEDAFRRILAELREQYVLGFYPSTGRGDGSWHRIKVRLAGSGLKVRAREGYVDY